MYITSLGIFLILAITYLLLVGLKRFRSLPSFEKRQEEISAIIRKKFCKSSGQIRIELNKYFDELLGRLLSIGLLYSIIYILLVGVFFFTLKTPGSSYASPLWQIMILVGVFYAGPLAILILIYRETLLLRTDTLANLE